MAKMAKQSGMTKYQFEIDENEWRAWKNTVPRSKSLDSRIRELIKADTEGRVLEEDDETDTREHTREPMDVSEPEVAEPEQSKPVKQQATSADVAAVVERVSDSWTDTDERLAARRAAARAVLQHAVDDGEPIGKTEALEQFRDDHPVEGQADETWWRKNIRPVLSEVGTYSNGAHGYVVESLDEN